MGQRQGRVWAKGVACLWSEVLGPMSEVRMGIYGLADVVVAAGSRT